MIGLIEGIVRLKKKDALIVTTSGIGYVVSVPQRLWASVSVNDSIVLYTHTHVREDTLQLYGFAHFDELVLFELLISVSGIGPKSALAILERGVGQVQRAVVQADVGFFKTIPRLGSKNAQKIIIELKTKLGSVKDLDLEDDTSGETEELIAALVSTGFSKIEAVNVVKRIPHDMVNLEEKLRYAFKLLGGTTV